MIEKKVLWRNAVAWVVVQQFCKKFLRSPLKWKKDAFLLHIHIKFPDSFFDSLPRFHEKIKMTIWKIANTFGLYNRVVTSFGKIVDDTKFAWLAINPEKHSCI